MNDLKCIYQANFPFKAKLIFFNRKVAYYYTKKISTQYFLVNLINFDSFKLCETLNFIHRLLLVYINYVGIPYEDTTAELSKP